VRNLGEVVDESVVIGVLPSTDGDDPEPLQQRADERDSQRRGGTEARLGDLRRAVLAERARQEVR